MIDELIEKWQDVVDHADDYLEKTLAEEILEDLKQVRRYVN